MYKKFIHMYTERMSVEGTDCIHSDSYVIGMIGALELICITYFAVRRRKTNAMMIAASATNGPAVQYFCCWSD